VITIIAKHSPVAACQNVTVSVGNAVPRRCGGSTTIVLMPTVEPVTLTQTPPGPYRWHDYRDADGETNSSDRRVSGDGHRRGPRAPGLSPADIFLNIPPVYMVGSSAYQVTATDNVPGDVTIKQHHPADSFPTGYEVTCTATDASGNTAQCVFHVTIGRCVTPAVGRQLRGAMMRSIWR